MILTERYGPLEHEAALTLNARTSFHLLSLECTTELEYCQPSKNHKLLCSFRTKS